MINTLYDLTKEKPINLQNRNTSCLEDACVLRKSSSSFPCITIAKNQVNHLRSVPEKSEFYESQGKRSKIDLTSDIGRVCQYRSRNMSHAHQVGRFVFNFNIKRRKDRQQKSDCTSVKTKVTMSHKQHCTILYLEVCHYFQFLSSIILFCYR